MLKLSWKLEYLELENKIILEQFLRLLQLGLNAAVPGDKRVELQQLVLQLLVQPLLEPSTTEMKRTTKL